MSYSYTRDDIFTVYDDRESKLIEKWLKKHGYKWFKPTVCGNCCGIYDGYYRVDGIGGKWKTKADKKAFAKFADENGILYDKEELDDSTINPLVEDK